MRLLTRGYSGAAEPHETDSIWCLHGRDRRGLGAEDLGVLGGWAPGANCRAKNSLPRVDAKARRKNSLHFRFWYA